jgi:hypothetical protein
MHRVLLPAVLACLFACATTPAAPPRSAPAAPAAPAAAPIGYTDTPLLPDGYHVHDPQRQPPPVVDASGDADLLVPPPPDAIVLFDGHDASAWLGEDGQPARWAVVNGALEANGTGSIHTREDFGDCQLHLEWRTPEVVKGESQARGNSGVFLMSRYEVQVLDSYDNRTYADGQAAALYGQRAPRRNASRPPGEWQSYDITFHAPRFADGLLAAPARVSVRHNGVPVHDDVAFLGATVHRALAAYTAHAPQAPLMLQDHGDPVRYRNIWLRRLP